MNGEEKSRLNKPNNDDDDDDDDDNGDNDLVRESTVCQRLWGKGRMKRTVRTLNPIVLLHAPIKELDSAIAYSYGSGPPLLLNKAVF
ncbi:unnamed protein product [Porites evermanni]|uniref:Uncharacterized protein n=1 Tax=Porites evermanni TaxID=104178 RepID=A0ABN8SMQ9_9CNID|nr:unnamed protein product [Porites evermanni]